MRRACLAALLVLAVSFASVAPGQTVRFQTSVGAFDMLLNPTNNADLQPLVDNMLANVAAGVYRKSVVNRAADGFVLQIGSFTTESIDVDETPFFGFESSNNLNNVIVDADDDGQVDFDTTGLTNTRGTVSLALSAAGPNSGSASFFVNVGDNQFLDSQGFVTFATVSDLTTVDRIMSQTIVDLSSDVNQPGSLAYTDVPLADDGDLIVIESAIVVSESNFSFVGPLINATTPVVEEEEAVEASLSAASIMSEAPPIISPGFVESIPEPGALLIASMGVLLTAFRRR